MDTKDKSPKTVLANRLDALFSIKSLITLALVGTLCFLSIRQNVQIPVETLTMNLGVVIGFFFAKKSNKDEDK